jgi:hypothetical protein
MAQEGWSLAAQAQLGSGQVRPAILFRMATDPVVRLWAGAGDVAIPADLIEDDDGAVYTGLGELVGLPELNQLINGAAERVEFTMAAAELTSEIADLAASEADLVRGAAVTIGFYVFDQDWQRLSPVDWLWDGTADSLKINRAPDGESAIRSITLSVGSLFTGRRRPALAYWTDPDQRRRSSDDRFCERVKLHNAGWTRTWPI